jgi:hypothetical protein
MGNFNLETFTGATQATEHHLGWAGHYLEEGKRAFAARHIAHAETASDAMRKHSRRGWQFGRVADYQKVIREFKQ